MHSGMIGKIEKAHRYAQEPERVKVNDFAATFRGGHDSYTVALHDNHWTCSCHTFESHAVGGTCSHIMSIQTMLAPMLSSEAKFTPEPEPTLH